LIRRVGGHIGIETRANFFEVETESMERGCSKIDSIVLGQHAVYNNLEERK
jgi:hypothetical protein